MQTREELVAGLEHALGLMQKVVVLERQHADIRSQYARTMKSQRPLTGILGIGAAVLMAFVLMVFISMTMIWNIIAQIFWLMLDENLKAAKTLASLVIFGVSLPPAFVIKSAINKAIIRKNEEIRLTNIKINEKNESLYAAEQETIRQIQNVREQYAREILPWYPADYCSIEEAEFFLNAVRNYRADSIKEAVNLYEDTSHKMRMEQAQQQMLQKQDSMVRQMKLNNLLAIGNMAMQADTQNAIDRNTQAVNSLHQTILRRRR